MKAGEGCQNPTCQIKEVGILMELVENIAGAVLDIRCCYNGNCFLRQFRGEFGSALCIFDRGDAGSD
jgi:hypothetical protein